MLQPKHIYHYTSVDVLCKLFANIQNQQFVFHASSVFSMNDSAEYCVAIDQCVDDVDRLIMERELGVPFALCFSDSDANIPMWNMYANSGRGICLQFNFEKLKDYIYELKKRDERTMLFSQCDYKVINVNNKRPFDSGKDYPNKLELKRKMIDAAFIKPNCFSHEREWRLMIWQDWVPNDKHKIFFKERQEELCPYIEVPIHIKCLEGIILNPNASEQMIEATRLLLANYGGISINVDTANITLKV